MITISQIAQVIQDLYNNISKTNTAVSISITPELKKFYGSYGTLPSNISANIKEIACEPIGVNSVISYQSAYNIEMLVPEIFIEPNENIWKSLQMEYQGRLVDLTSYTALSGYNLKLSFEDCVDSTYNTHSNGNCKVVSIIIRALVDQNIANGSDHSFALVVGSGASAVEYNIPFTKFEFGEQKSLRMGNFGTDGRIGAIAQSQSFSCTFYCVLLKNNFWKNVILPILFSFTGYEATLKIEIKGTTYIQGQTDNRASIPVIINILNYNGENANGIICAINCVYRG